MQDNKIVYLLVLWLLLFVAGMMLLIPFPYHLLPNIGAKILPSLESTSHYFGLTFVAFVPANTKGILQIAGFVVIVSFLLTMFLGAFLRITSNKIWINTILHTLSAYFLSLQLLKYGFEKVFKHQFYAPEPNILFTPLGFLEKDILFWSTMGTSWTYNFLGGMIEVLAAVLLLFRKTRIFGACLSLTILLQIAMINVSFQIGVLGFVSFLILLNLIVLKDSLLSIYAFFIQLKSTQLFSPSLPPLGKWSAYHIPVKYSLIALIFIESLYPFLLTHNWNDDKAPRPIYHGAYEITALHSVDSLSNLQWKRLFFHRQGYCIVQNQQDKMQDYALEWVHYPTQFLLYDSDNQTIAHLSVAFDSIHQQLQILGLWQKDSLSLRAKKIPLDALPLHKQ